MARISEARLGGGHPLRAELQPSVFYGWQRYLFEHGAAAFGESRKRAETRG